MKMSPTHITVGPGGQLSLPGSWHLCSAKADPPRSSLGSALMAGTPFLPGRRSGTHPGLDGVLSIFIVSDTTFHRRCCSDTVLQGSSKIFTHKSHTGCEGFHKLFTSIFSIRWPTPGRLKSGKFKDVSLFPCWRLKKLKLSGSVVPEDQVHRAFS